MSAHRTKLNFADRLRTIFREGVLSVDYAQNLVVIKTISGSAHVAGEAIDSLKWPEVVGTISGDNTLLVIAQSAQDADTLMHKFEQMKK